MFLNNNIKDSFLLWNKEIKNSELRKRIFSILLPPPNITGELHMGHAFQQSIIDLCIRFHHMNNKNAKLYSGIDHAGIATQILIEKMLLNNKNNILDININKKEIFIKNWKENLEHKIKNQMKSLGILTDYSKFLFTMDNKSKQFISRAFVQLYNDNLIYKSTKLLNWDIVLKTAISDLEILKKEEKKELFYIDYPLINNTLRIDEKYITIATTRPETLFGDTAIAINKDDIRYKKFINNNTYAINPITKKHLPIVSHKLIKKNFGSGCVKITPAHDKNDYIIGKDKKLEFINIFNIDGTLNNKCGKFSNLDIFTARKRIIDEIQHNGYLRKKEIHKGYNLYNSRTNNRIEILLGKQWFLKTKQLSHYSINALKNRDINFIPDHWNKFYLNWLYNIEDWCISRQIWWGHRIPIWYDNRKNVYCGLNEQEIRKKYNISKSIILVQETDVLDTWFSSALWPLLSIDWNLQKIQDNLYLYDLLVTGFDILFFWVARMIMLCFYFTKKYPFKNIYIHGLIKDINGKKMSKSKGNVINPLDVINGINITDLVNKRLSYGSLFNRKEIAFLTKKEFPQGIPSIGSDALRLTFYSLANLGKNNIIFDINRGIGFRNLCNKIWNAFKYIEIIEKQLNDFSFDFNKNFRLLQNIDKWISNKINIHIKKYKKYILLYRFDLLIKEVNNFFWENFCGWYIEFFKSRIKILGDKNIKIIYKNYLKNIFLDILKLYHPIIPFLTEKIWKILYIDKKKEYTSILNENIPNSKQHPIYIEEFSQIEKLRNIIQNIRKYKSILSINKIINIFFNIKKNTIFPIIKYRSYIQDMCKIYVINEYKHLMNNNTYNKFNFHIENSIQVIFFFEEKVDEKINIINRKIKKIRLNIVILNKQLKNKNFLIKAPKNIIQERQVLLSEYEKQLKEYSNIINTLRKNK